MEYYQLKAKAEMADRMFKNGAQSKQYEIDELKKRINLALKELEYIHFYKTQNSDNAIKILKGEKLNENLRSSFRE